MKVAVVIPCYNVVDHVEGAVRSVWEQTHQDLDVVAVDDGSTDGTLAVLERLAAVGPGQLRVLMQPNGGACKARNLGLHATMGEYVQFLDADDLLMPGKIADQVALARQAGCPALIAGAYRNVWEDGRTEVVRPLDGSDWMALVRTRLGTTSADLWQRSSLLAVGGWKEDLASSQDYELAFRILCAGGRVARDHRVSASILKRSAGSISRSDEVGNWIRYIQLRAAMRDHLLATDPLGHAAEIVEVEQYLYSATRALSRTDRERARELQDRYVRRGFKPRSGRGLSFSYTVFHRWFGARAAESAAAALDNLRRFLSRR